MWGKWEYIIKSNYSRKNVYDLEYAEMNHGMLLQCMRYEDIGLYKVYI